MQRPQDAAQVGPAAMPQPGERVVGVVFNRGLGQVQLEQDPPPGPAVSVGRIKLRFSDDARSISAR